MPTAIQVENLSKAYRIGLKEEIPDTLAGAIASWLRVPLKNFHRLRRLNTFRANGDGEDIIWALKDVSFEVREGEVLGIIGRNGAGKSTLLKILSRITEPTSGRATIRGRVSSLLEVGTGFHPELTGRENVYLNGTILGMTKREINRKFDEIVDFSGVEQFLDTPIKRYSSGMKVRLAFAVAAHLDPEILLIDEVLAVGDIAFQRKCLGRMQDVAGQGRTVLFVSHQLDAIQALCTRVIVLDAGRALFEGPTPSGIDHYLSVVRTLDDRAVSERTDRTGKGGARFMTLRFRTPDGILADSVPCGGPVVLEADVVCDARIRDVICSFEFYTTLGQRLFRLKTKDSGLTIPEVKHHATFRCTVESLNLMPGTYSISLSLNAGFKNRMDRIESAGRINVIPATVAGSCRVPGAERDLLVMPCTWSIYVD